MLVNVALCLLFAGNRHAGGVSRPTGKPNTGFPDSASNDAAELDAVSRAVNT